MNAASAGSSLGKAQRQRVIRRQRKEGGAEKRVRTRREDFDATRLARRSRRTPGRLPSGRSSSPASAARAPASDRARRSLRAALRYNAVMRRNHCDRSRFSTIASDRQPRPSITCSLARTVFSTGIPIDPGFLAIGEPRPRGSRETSSARAGNIPDGRWRSRATSHRQSPCAASWARIVAIFSCGPNAGDGFSRRWLRSRPAGRTRPIPSGAAHYSPAPAGSGRRRSPIV